MSPVYKLTLTTKPKIKGTKKLRNQKSTQTRQEGIRLLTRIIIQSENSVLLAASDRVVVSGDNHVLIIYKSLRVKIWPR